MRNLATAMLFLVTSGLAAQDAPTPEDAPRTAQEVEEVFAAIDRNGDRQITRAEAAAQDSLLDRFAGVDADGDGRLSKAEFRARPSAEPFE